MADRKLYSMFLSCFIFCRAFFPTIPNVLQFFLMKNLVLDQHKTLFQGWDGRLYPPSPPQRLLFLVTTTSHHQLRHQATDQSTDRPSPTCVVVLTELKGHRWQRPYVSSGINNEQLLRKRSKSNYASHSIVPAFRDWRGICVVLLDQDGGS